MRMLHTSLAALLAFPLLAAIQEPVKVEGGLITGTPGWGWGVREYLGVPFAAPPVGSLRWAPPQPPAPWSGTHDATHPAKMCAQGTVANEDCLYLNITVPRGPGKRSPKPVMVWVHGGGLSVGAGSTYDPRRMATEGDVIVVTIDFRLNVFGFFAYEGLAGSGTFGFQDQQAALRWVERNIAAFGGDPHNVTLFGESGGGVGTCAQLTSPAAVGLFDKVIMQSGGCSTSWPRNGAYLG